MSFEILHFGTYNQLNSNCQFIPCDVREWDQQVQLFEAAVQNSPRKSCDTVIANAGIWGPPEQLANSTGMTLHWLGELDTRNRPDE